MISLGSLNLRIGRIGVVDPGLGRLTQVTDLRLDAGGDILDGVVVR